MLPAAESWALRAGSRSRRGALRDPGRARQLEGDADGAASAAAAASSQIESRCAHRQRCEAAEQRGAGDVAGDHHRTLGAAIDQRA
jgi:hypothetical protein